MTFDSVPRISVPNTLWKGKGLNFQPVLMLSHKRIKRIFNVDLELGTSWKMKYGLSKTKHDSHLLFLGLEYSLSQSNGYSRMKIDITHVLADYFTRHPSWTGTLCWQFWQGYFFFRQNLDSLEGFSALRVILNAISISPRNRKSFWLSRFGLN